MRWFENLLRRARIRNLTEGKVQRARTEALDDDAKDDAERWQDYGFACNAVDGQGLVINAGGHTIVLRMDRLAERPQLAAHQVCIWHKEGHKITLMDGGLIQVDCTALVVNTETMTVNASSQVDFNTPTVNMSGDLNIAGTATAAVDVLAAGTSGHTHHHGGVKGGSDTSGPPV